MFEKRFAAVPVQVFTANGGADGSISIADTSLFKVKQRVVITAIGQVNQELEVKKIASPTVLIVGPTTGSITTFTDISAYTTASSGSVFANEQKRPQIPPDDFERAVYEEEPTVAKRVVMVDKHGVIYDDDNPLPATFTGSIAVGDVDQGDPNTAANAWPVKISDGTNAVAVNPDGSINVNIATVENADGLTITFNEISSVSSGVETVVATLTAPPLGTRVQKVDVSGDNVALYKVKLDGNTIAAKRTWWSNFNEGFDFESFVNGLLLTSGQVLTVTVLHSRPYLGSFEATIMSI